MPRPKYQVIESRNFLDRCDAMYLAFSDVYFRENSKTPSLQLRLSLGDKSVTQHALNGVLLLCEFADIGVHAWEFPHHVNRKIHFPSRHCPEIPLPPSIHFDFHYDGESQIKIFQRQEMGPDEQRELWIWEYFLRREHIALTVHEAVWQCYDRNRAAIRQAIGRIKDNNWRNAQMKLLLFLERKLMYFDNLLSDESNRDLTHY